ncbi:MAG: HlyC/CorC family transporter [Planctomycetes bacterium]|nr:HlyC/CorC family transporter [Planctomycetota bacterium]
MGDGAYWALAVAASAGSFLAALCRYAVQEYSAAHYLERYGRFLDSAARERLSRRLEATDAIEGTLAVGDTALRALAVLAAAFAIVRTGGGPPVAFIAAACGVIGLQLVLLDFLPQAVARTSAERALHLLLPALHLAGPALRGFERIRAGLLRRLARILGGRSHRVPAEAVEEDILSAVEEGEREGVLREGEKRMIESIIEFRDVEVKEVMTPRTEMVAIRADAPCSEAINLIRRSGFSRIPVYQGSRDSIAGILYAKDILFAWGDADPAERPVEDLARKAYFVPETKKVSTLFAEFRNQRFHIAIVLDEYGGTAGLVTLEDIVEEIVGDISDEYAPRETKARIRRIDARTIEVDGRVHVDELNEEYGLSIPAEGDYETIGGFLFASLGTVPRTGDSLETDGLRFEILEADERRILWVRIRATPAPGGGTDPAVRG